MKKLVDAFTENAVDLPKPIQNMTLILAIFQKALVSRPIFGGRGLSHTGEEQTSLVSRGHRQDFVQTAPKWA